MDREPLAVVCALILDDTGRVLVAQRPAHKHLGGRWEFPGGKIEPGETAAAALTREISEELACKIKPVSALARIRHDYGVVFIELIPYLARLAPESPPPAAAEHVALRWVKPDELDGIDLAPADRRVAGELRAAVIARPGEFE